MLAKINKKLILKILITLICLTIFIFLTYKVFNKEILELDIKGYNLVNKLISKYITPIVIFITNLGSSIILIGISILLLILVKNKKIGLSICYNLLFIAILNVILKNIIGRVRPSGNMIIHASGFSFPSGHSMISAAFYGYLIYLIYKNLNNKKVKYLLIFTLSLLIVLIGISRVYLGVHYVSDVIGGFIISIAYLIIFVSISKKYIGGKNEIS